jgi:hypothetical protein
MLPSLAGTQALRAFAAVALSEQTTLPQQSHSCHVVAVCRIRVTLSPFVAASRPRWLPLSL